MEDLSQGAARRLLDLPAGEPLGGWVEGDDLPLGVGRDHAVGDAGQGDLEPFPISLLVLKRPPSPGGAGQGTPAGGSHGPAQDSDGQPGCEKGEGDLRFGPE